MSTDTEADKTTANVPVTEIDPGGTRPAPSSGEPKTRPKPQSGDQNHDPDRVTDR